MAIGRLCYSTGGLKINAKFANLIWPQFRNPQIYADYFLLRHRDCLAEQPADCHICSTTTSVLSTLLACAVLALYENLT